MPTEEQTYRQSVLDKLADIKSEVGEVKIQTMKTNGRVTRLEKWQSYVIGFAACLSILAFSVAIPIISSYIQAGKL